MPSVYAAGLDLTWHGLMSDTEPFGARAPGTMLGSALRATRAMPDTWAGRRLAYAMRKIALSWLDTSVVDMETIGIRLRLRPAHNVCEKRALFTPQYFDPAEREALRQHIAARDQARDYVFVDIGANVGIYALYVASLAGQRARIVAIEPQPDIFDRLIENIRLNPFGTVKALDCAVADKPGELTLFIDARNKGESSVRILGSNAAASIRVPATTLQDLLVEQGFSHVDAIKLDVEGAEDLILETFLLNAAEHLFPRLLILEDGSSRWQGDLVGLLETKGYRLRCRTRLNFVFERS